MVKALIVIDVQNDFRGWRERLIDWLIRKGLYYFPARELRGYLEGAENLCPEDTDLRGSQDMQVER